MTWTAYGRDAAQALRDAVAGAKGDDPLAPVTVVVPSNHVGVAMRRLLASGAVGPVSARGSGLAAVTFLTVYRLAELLGAAALAAAARRPVSTPVVAAALRSALQADPGVFEPVALHPATEAALVASYRELRDVGAAGLDALAAAGHRASDVVRLHRAARSALAAGWYDEEDLLSSATAAVADPAAVRALGTVVVHLPQRLSLHAGALLRALSAVADMEIVAGTIGDPAADAEVVAAVGLVVGDEVKHPEASVTTPVDVVAAGRTEVLTTSDADDEVRAAVRVVLDAVRRGTPLDRIAVLHAAPEPYGRLVHEHLAAAGIGVNGAASMSLSARAAPRALLRMLSLPGDDFRRQDVFAWLAGAPILDGDGPAPVAAWERLSRAAAVTRGRAEWDRLLAALADDLDRLADARAEDPDSGDWLAARDRREAAAARALRRFVLDLADELAVAGRTRRPWSDHARWASGIVDRYLGDDATRAVWPVEEQRAAERLERALDRLAALDAVEDGVDLDVFVRTLDLELDADLGRTGRFGDGVLVGGVALGIGLDLDLVVVLGLAEGTFPAPVRDDSLLPDRERERCPALPLRRSQVDRQHRALVATLAGATRQVLCVPRGDLRRSNERVPSRWVLDVAGALHGRPVSGTDLERLDAEWLLHVPSFDAGLRATSFPATAQEHRLRALLAAGIDRHDLVAGAASVDGRVAAGAAVVDARRSGRFTRFDGNVAGAAVPSPTARPTSASALETWTGCPFAYLLHHVLRVRPVENPEEQLRLSPLAHGNLVHEALERFLVESLERPGGAPAPGDAWTADDHRRLQEIGAEVCDRFERHGMTGRPLFWRGDRRRILGDLDRFLHLDSEHRRTEDRTPVAAELGFGVAGSPLPAVPLALPDGRVIRFRGRADRLDVSGDGTIRVVDYKTGKTNPYKGLSTENPTGGGVRLQLPVYAAAGRLHQGTPSAPVRAEYWFVSWKGDFVRIGYDVTDDVRARVGTTLAAIVDGIEQGAFPNHPTAVSSSPFVECAYCDPDSLGVVDLRRQWERKRRDPTLAPHADFVEPLADETDDDRSPEAVDA